MAFGPSILTQSPLLSGEVSLPYSLQFTGASGAPPYGWTVIAGSLPSGLTLLPNGLLSGTPTGAFSGVFTVQLLDSALGKAQRQYSMTIVAQLLITTTSPLTGANQGVPFSPTIATTGGAGGNVFSITAQSGGNTYSINGSSGQISCTPLVADTDSVTVQVVDALGVPATRVFSITVASSYVPVTISTISPLPQATVGVPYSFSMAAINGTLPYTWAETGTLPAGLSFSTAGVISGTPSAAITATLNISVTDAHPTTVGPIAFTLTVNAAITPSTTAYKFNPGDYAVTEQVYRCPVAQAMTEIDVLTLHPSTTIGYVYGQAWYQLDTAATNLNNPANIAGAGGQFTGFQNIATVFNYLQSKIPGAHFGCYINANASATQITISTIATANYGNGFPVPKWIANCGGSLTMPVSYGSSTTTTATVAAARGTGGYYGFGYSGWNGVNNVNPATPPVATYAEYVTALWDPQVNQAWINMWEALSKWKFLITAGPLAGQTLGLNENPLIEFLGINDEYSYAMQSSQNATGFTNNPPLQTGSANSPTPANYFAHHKLWAQKAASFFPNTMIGLCDSFGFTALGADGAPDLARYVNANIDGTGLSSIRGIAYSNSDVYGLDWSTGSNAFAVAGKQGYAGIANAQYNPCTLNAPTVASLKGVMPILGQIQPADYNRNCGTTGYTAAAVVALNASMIHDATTHRLWGMADNNTDGTGFGTQAWTRYVAAAVATLPPPTQTLPSSLATLNVLTLSLPNAQNGFAYSQALQFAGGTAPYTVSMVATPNTGAWLSCSSTGLLTGTPGTAETESVAITVVDSLGIGGSTTLSLLVTPVTGTLAITTATTLPAATNGGGYFYKLAISGGVPPYATIMGTVSGATGTAWQCQSCWDSGYVEGNPITNGTDTFPVTVTDSVGATATVTFSLTVNATLTIQNISLNSASQPLPSAMVGNKYSHTLSGAGGTGTGYVWTDPGATLPAGLSISGAKIVGTPTIAGNFSAINLTLTDSGAHVATAAFSLGVAANQNVTRPSFNSSVSNGFFVKSGQLYDPNGAPFRIRGINQNHWDAGGDQNAYLLSKTNAARVLIDSGSSDATQATAMNTQHLANGQFVLATRFYTSGIYVTSGTGSSGSSSLPILNDMTATWIQNFSTWSPLQQKIAINIANEWGPSNANWLNAYLGIVANITAISGAVITCNTVSATNPFAALQAIGGLLYIKSAGGITNQVAVISAVGGSSGAWTVTATAPISGAYTSGGILNGGAVACLRAAGYTCPLVIDCGGSGQDHLAIPAYAATILASDPLKNLVFSYHLYGTTTPIACPITAITKAGSASISFTNPTAKNGGFAQNPFNNGIYNGFYFGTAFVSGVQGMTQINGLSAATSFTAGTAPNYTITFAANSSAFGTYTGGGWIYDANHYQFTISQLAALQSNGVCVILGEFGPSTPPLGVGQGSNTLVSVGQVIRTCEANGIGFCYWAMDDGFGFGGYTATVATGTYNVPHDLSWNGLDMILNPQYGIASLAQPASFYL